MPPQLPGEVPHDVYHRLQVIQGNKTWISHRNSNKCHFCKNRSTTEQKCETTFKKNCHITFKPMVSLNKSFVLDTDPNKKRGGNQLVIVFLRNLGGVQCPNSTSTPGGEKYPCGKIFFALDLVSSPPFFSNFTENFFIACFLFFFRRCSSSHASKKIPYLPTFFNCFEKCATASVEWTFVFHRKKKR